MTSKYSPFNKPIDEVTADDLSVLQGVREGWYVDYKRDEIGAKEIAKAVGAFANTYGGWLFVGIGEKSKEEPVAQSFPGVPRDTVDAVSQRIRQAVNSHLSPAPRFDVHTFWGPKDELGLAEDMAIICVEVPESRITPHVHSDGRIYRRVSDSSEPKPETDRHLLDALWGRRREAEKETREWVERRPEFSKAEAEAPFVRLMIAYDPWGERDPWLSASLPEVRELLSAKNADYVPSIPFDAVHSTAEGFVARQLKGNNPNRLSLTWTFRRDLSGEVLIPLTCFDLDDIRMVSYELDGYAHGERFEAILTKYSFERVRFVDLNALFYVLSGVAAHQRHLLALAGAKGSFKVKIQLLNCWRTVPFLDADYALESYDQSGPPVSLTSDILVPPGYDPDSFAEIADPAPQLQGGAASMSQAFMMLVWISRALGLPLDVPDDPAARVYPDLTELYEAAERSLVAQRLRNERNAS